MTIRVFAAVAVLLLAAGVVFADSVAPVKPAVEPFKLEQVRLLPGPFKTAMDLNSRDPCWISTPTGCCTHSA